MSTVSLLTDEQLTVIHMPPLVAVVITAPKAPGSRIYQTRVYEIRTPSGCGVCRWKSPDVGHMRRTWAHSEAVKGLRLRGREFWEKPN